MPTRVLTYGILLILLSLFSCLPDVVGAASGLVIAPHLQQCTNLSDLALNPETFERSVWASAKPYLDDPLPQLIDIVPELHGLDATPDQVSLADLLKKTAEQRSGGRHSLWYRKSSESFRRDRTN